MADARKSLLAVGRLTWATVLLGAVIPGCIAQDPTENLPVIERDLAIIGGGSSGCYSAITAKQDYNLSVVIVEKVSRLGGQVSSWDDPETKKSYDAGVQVYFNISGAQRHFDRLGVPMGPPAAAAVTPTRYVDFTNGKEVAFTPPANADRLAAFRKFLAIMEKYEDRLDPGYHNFYSAEDIPEDLSMPIDKFVEKHNLTAAIPQFYNAVGFGEKTFRTKPALSLMRSLPPAFMRVFLGESLSVVPASKRIMDIYDASQRLIGDENILFNTVVESGSSNLAGEGNLACTDINGPGNVTLIVRDTKTGKKTKIIAKRLLITAIPSDENLAPLPVIPILKNMFSRMWTFPSTAIVSVISHPALPLNMSLNNIPEAASPDHYDKMMSPQPYITRFTNFPGTKYFRATVGGDEKMTVERAKPVFQENLDRLIAAGALKDPGPPQPITYHMITTHGVGGAHPTAEDMKGGFWDVFNQNDGKCGAWFTGRWFGNELSTHIWQECEVTMKKIVASLGGK